jgi:hypothetical protein
LLDFFLLDLNDRFLDLFRLLLHGSLLGLVADFLVLPVLEGKLSNHAGVEI